MQGLSAAKRSALQEIAEQLKVDIICLQETHVDKDISSRFTINGFSLLSYHLHPKFGRATYIKNSLVGATASQHNDLWDACKLDQFSIINVYKPPSIDWTDSNLPTSLSSPTIYVGDFNSHHNDWGYESCDENGNKLALWAETNDLVLIHDAKQPGSFHSARWGRD